jgi:hypothetical protein
MGKEPGKTIAANVNTSGLYRMPWTQSDNSSTWLEITRACDITCEYCVQEHKGTTHKPFSQVCFEIDELLRLRKTDSIVVAGGEPLIHPDLIKIVHYVNEKKIKPVIITNAVKLTKELVLKLKDAGLFGFILHIDSGQHRPDWLGSTENELNTLREQLSTMINDVGGLVCSFITTVTPDSLKGMNDIVRWTLESKEKVVQNIFIPVRGLYSDDPWEYIVDGKTIQIDSTAYLQERTYKNMTALDLYTEMKKEVPDLQFSSFLGGTKLSDSPKWLFSLYLHSNSCSYGTAGPRAMEIIQSIHHLFTGRYVSFFKQAQYTMGRLAFLLGLFDRDMRNAFKKYIKSLIKNPRLIFEKVYVQSLIIMQPFDILENGESDLCDGCPNKTYWNGRLVSECRMEEYLNYGTLMRFIPKST